MLKFTHTLKVSGFLLLVLLTGVACGGGPSESDIQLAIVQTQEAQKAIDEVVALTVAAQAPPPVQDPVQEPVQDPAPPAVDPNAPDVANQAATGIEPIAVAPDPNVVPTTPQLSVIYSSINVRIGPGTTCRPFSALLQNSVVPLVGKNQDGSWLLITMPNGQQGWVADSVTDPVPPTNMANVPISANIPVCPTATPLATATKPPTATATATLTLATATATTAGATPTTAAATPTTAAATATATAVPQAPMATITIVNNSGLDICTLFVDPSADPWSNDRLFPDVLLDGEQLQLGSFPEDFYDFFAGDCLGNFDQVSASSGEFVSGSFVWNIR